MELKDAIKSIEQKFGKGAVKKLGDSEKINIERFSSGSLLLDEALGGGFPCGLIVELMGWESSGKSSLATIAAASVQKKGKLVGYIDVEHTFDPKYSDQLGLISDNIYLSQPSCGEEAAEIGETLVKTGDFGVIIFDSVAAMTPRAELEGDFGDTKMGLHARLMSQTMRKITSVAKNNKCTLIFINQFREKIGVMYGDPKVVTGGNALKFYASQRLEITKSKNIEVKGETIGFNMKIKVIKNKTGTPFKKIETPFILGKGFDQVREICTLAEQSNIIQRKGAWYNYGEIKLGQGMENTLSLLEDNPELLEEIKEKTLNKQ